MYGSSLTQLSTLLGSDFGVLWVTYGVEMMSLHHSWGSYRPQIASCIHIRYIQSVWANWYAVHRHKVAALHSYPPYLAQIWGLWVTCGVKTMRLCHCWGWQPPQTASRSILDIYKVFEHIDMLSIGIRWQHYTGIHPTWLRFWGSGSLMWSQNDVITSWLRLTATSNCFPHSC